MCMLYSNPPKNNILQLTSSKVVAASLYNLSRALCALANAGTAKVEHIILSHCYLDMDCCQLLSNDAFWPLCLQRIELHGCRLADPSLTSNKRLFAHECLPADF